MTELAVGRRTFAAAWRSTVPLKMAFFDTLEAALVWHGLVERGPVVRELRRALQAWYWARWGLA